MWLHWNIPSNKARTELDIFDEISYSQIGTKQKDTECAVTWAWTADPYHNEQFVGGIIFGEGKRGLDGLYNPKPVLFG